MIQIRKRVDWIFSGLRFGFSFFAFIRHLSTSLSHRDMVSKIETGAYAGAPAILEAIRTLEYAGVEFTNGDAPGVKLRKR